MLSAPWKSILKSVMSEDFKILKSSTFIPIQPMQFSTFDLLTNRPTNRSVIFRGFIGERKDEINKNEISEYLNSVSSKVSMKLNPEIETDLLVITTDIRSPKVKQLLKNSGFEICWWFPSAYTQFRLSGNAYVLPSPTNPIIDHFPSELLLSDSLPFDLKSLIGQFDWEQERKRYWYESSSDIRATFLKPPSGQDINEVGMPNVVEKLDPIGKNTEEKILVNKALENFGIVVMKVDYVDYLELMCTPHKRTIWKFHKNDDDDGINKSEWVEKNVIP